MEKQGRQAATRGERSFKETDKSQVLRKTFLGSGIWKTKKGQKEEKVKIMQVQQVGLHGHSEVDCGQEGWEFSEEKVHYLILLSSPLAR